MSPELSGLSFCVQQASNSTTTVYDGNGFKSACSGNGNFSQQFNVVGTFFYISGPVDPYGAINMKGRVIVNDYKSKSFDITVKVGGVTAAYNGSVASQSDSSISDCQSGVTNTIQDCDDVDPFPRKQNSSRFTFSKCSTPEVTAFSPNIGRSGTILTIKGKGFGGNTCLNEVKLASRDCVVQTSSENEITCSVSTGNQLPAGKDALYSSDVTRVTVKGKSWGLEHKVQFRKRFLIRLLMACPGRIVWYYIEGSRCMASNNQSEQRNC